MAWVDTLVTMVPVVVSMSSMLSSIVVVSISDGGPGGVQGSALVHAVHLAIGRKNTAELM